MLTSSWNNLVLILFIRLILNCMADEVVVYIHFNWNGHVHLEGSSLVEARIGWLPLNRVVVQLILRLVLNDD